MTIRSPQVVLFSPDVERAAEFYRELGFVEKFRTPTEGAPIHVERELTARRDDSIGRTYIH